MKTDHQKTTLELDRTEILYLAQATSIFLEEAEKARGKKLSNIWPGKNFRFGIARALKKRIDTQCDHLWKRGAE